MNSAYSSSYQVILADKYNITEYVESITLDESLTEISYKARIKLLINNSMPQIIPNQKLQIFGLPFQQNSHALLFEGLIWECESTNQGTKHLLLTAYDQTIIFAKCEDEYLFPQGLTASQRIKKYAADWDITLSNIPDTFLPLPQRIHRAQPLYSMIRSDLKDTVKTGGKMYRLRMQSTGLEMVQLGQNENVWLLQSDLSLESVIQRRSLEGTVTQVKILGSEPNEGESPILAIETGEVEKYGTLQRIITCPTLTNLETAKKSAQQMLAGMQETFSITSLDINTIRAGDKIRLDTLELLVFNVSHQLGSPGHMNLELAWEDSVRRRIFYD